MSKYKNSNLLNVQGGKTGPSLSKGGSVLGISNQQQLPPNSLFHLFANNISNSINAPSTLITTSTTGNVTTSTTPTTSTTTGVSLIATAGTTTTGGSIPSPISSVTAVSSTSTGVATTTATSSALASSATGTGTGTTTTSSINPSTATTNTSNIIVIESNKEDDKECGNILMEINKGIRSNNIGDQVESILFFSHLIKFHPSPLIVNSVITRLSDIFRNTSNTVKYRILKVFQECSSEIHKVSNIEEVLKRIHSVILSNDPVARSLSLRLLGSVPHLIADKLYIHHSIRNCMQSHDQVELEATIFIMDRLCEISPLFSDSIIEKIHTVIQNVETPPITKLKYTRLFRHMHHSHAIATQSKEMLVGLLDLYPSSNFVTVILDTLTNLSLKHILYIDEHIKFLKNYGFLDSRVIVKVTTLKCLQRLAKVSPHSQFPILEIFDLLRDTPLKCYREIKYNALLLLSILSTSQYNKILEYSTTATKNNNNDSNNNNNNNDLISLLYQYSLDYDLKLSELSIQTLVNIIIESYNTHNYNDQIKNQLNQILNQTINNICIILKTQFTTNSNIHAVYKNFDKSSILLKSIIQLIKKDSKSLKPISNTIISLLDEIPYNILKSLFHCLSMCIPMNKSVLNQNSLDLILQYLNKIIVIENSDQLLINSNNQQQQQQKELEIYSNKYSIPMPVFVCIFKTFDDNHQKIQEISKSLLPTIQYILEKPKPEQLWNCYSLAQLAQNHGFHKIAKVIFSFLIHKVESESNYLWLKGLLSIATLENEISITCSTGSSGNVHFSKILNQLSNYHTSILSIKASSQQERSLQFQEDFILLHERYLFNILNLKSFLLQYNNNSNNNNTDKIILTKKYQSKSLIFKQLEFKYQLFLNQNQSKSKLPLDTKQILESFIFSCNSLVKLIDLIILKINNNNYNGDDNMNNDGDCIYNSNNKKEQHQKYENQQFINYFPLFKFCEFIQKKLQQNNNNNNNDNNNNNNNLQQQSNVLNQIEFLDQVLNSFIKIPMVYPSSFYLK